MGPDGSRGGGTPLSALAAAAGALALIAIAIALFGLSGNISEQNCIRKAEAQYPTVPVSAFSRDREATGPLKVSFSEERANAVRSC